MPTRASHRHEPPMPTEESSTTPMTHSIELRVSIMVLPSRVLAIRTMTPERSSQITSDLMAMTPSLVSSPLHRVLDESSENPFPMTNQAIDPSILSVLDHLPTQAIFSISTRVPPQDQLLPTLPMTIMVISKPNEIKPIPTTTTIDSSR